MMSGTKYGLLLALMTTLLVGSAGCVQDMWDGSRLRPLSVSPVFADGRSSRPLQPDTVAQGTLANDYLSLPPVAANGAETNKLPFPLTMAVLNRGQQRYDMYCTECHGYAGYGDGIVVKRGFPAPPSYHTDRLRHAPLGHFYDVITNGYGVMYPHNDRVQPADRWAIAAYIRALQLSQNAAPASVPQSAKDGSISAFSPSAPKQSPVNADIPVETLPGHLLNGDVEGSRR